MKPNTIKAIIRSLAPAVYAAIASVIAHFGYHAGSGTVVAIASGAFAILTVVLHAAERKWPWVGAFLGYIGAPNYAPTKKAALALKVADLQAEIARLQAQNAPVVPSVSAPAPAPIDPASVTVTA